MVTYRGMPDAVLPLTGSDEYFSLEQQGVLRRILSSDMTGALTPLTSGTTPTAFNIGGPLSFYSSGHSTYDSRLLPSGGTATSGRGALTFVGNVLQINTDPTPPFDYTTGRAGFVLQHRDTAALAGSQSVDGALFQFYSSGNAVITGGATVSNGFSLGVRSYHQKSGDGSAHAFTGVGDLYAVGSGGYNEIASFVGTATNIASTNGLVVFAEGVIKDGPSDTTSFDTRGYWGGVRLYRINAGSKSFVGFQFTSEGPADPDAMITGIDSARSMYKKGIDLGPLPFRTGLSLVSPNGSAIGWRDTLGTDRKVLGVDTTNTTWLQASTSAGSVEVRNFDASVGLTVNPTVGVRALHTFEAAGTTQVQYKANVTDGATNQKLSDLYATSGSLAFRLVNDAQSAATTWLSVTRSGTTPTLIALNATSVTVPTATAGDNSTNAASTAFVQAANFVKGTNLNYNCYNFTDSAGHVANYLISGTDTSARTAGSFDKALLGLRYDVTGSGNASPDPVTCNWLIQGSLIKAGWPATTVRGELDGISVVTRNVLDDTSAFIGNVGTTTGFGVILEGECSQFDAAGAQLRAVRCQLAAIEGGGTGANYSAGAILIAEKGEHDIGLQIQSTSAGFFDNFLKFINPSGHVFFSVDGNGTISIANLANTQNVTIGIDSTGDFAIKNTGSVTETFRVDQTGHAFVSASLQTQTLTLAEGGTTPVNHLSISATSNTGGAVISLLGNGATTPSKFIRARAGLLEITNNANTTAILTLTDAGVLSVPDLVVNGTHNVATAWTSDTATPTSNTGTFTTVACTRRYKKIGRTVQIQISVFITTNGTAATGIQIPLPFAAAALSVIPGREIAVSGKMLSGTINAGASALAVFNYDNTYPGGNGTNQVLTGIYEANS